MKLFRLNVNGIRAAISKGLSVCSKQSRCYCLQEIKATEDQIPVDREISAAGYLSILLFGNKKGYSG
jgi:exodeoxyribonuclease-3